MTRKSVLPMINMVMLVPILIMELAEPVVALAAALVDSLAVALVDLKTSLTHSLEEAAERLILMPLVKERIYNIL